MKSWAEKETEKKYIFKTQTLLSKRWAAASDLLKINKVSIHSWPFVKVILLASCTKLFFFLKTCCKVIYSFLQTLEFRAAEFSAISILIKPLCPGVTLFPSSLEECVSNWILTYFGDQWSEVSCLLWIFLWSYFTFWKSEQINSYIYNFKGFF